MYKYPLVPIILLLVFYTIVGKQIQAREDFKQFINSWSTLGAVVIWVVLISVFLVLLPRLLFLISFRRGNHKGVLKDWEEPNANIVRKILPRDTFVGILFGYWFSVASTPFLLMSLKDYNPIVITLSCLGFTAGLTMLLIFAQPLLKYLWLGDVYLCWKFAGTPPRCPRKYLMVFPRGVAPETEVTFTIFEKVYEVGISGSRLDRKKGGEFTVTTGTGEIYGATASVTEFSLPPSNGIEREIVAYPIAFGLLKFRIQFLV